MSSLDLSGFVSITRRIAADSEDFLPTMCDPEQHKIRVLEGVSDGVDYALATREWATGFGRAHYFIAYPSQEGISAEEYLNGERIAAVRL